MSHAPGALTPGGRTAPDTRGAVPETLASAYAAWDAARDQRAQVISRGGAERERLEVEGRFLLGAARAAANTPSPGAVPPGDVSLATSDGLRALVAEAEARVAASRAALERQLSLELTEAERACAAAQAEVISRVARYAAGTAVPVQLMLRPVGSARAVLHLGRLAPDEAVLLMHLLTGCVPSRHRFLEDESTEDLSLGSPPLYPDAGGDPGDLRPAPGALMARLAGIRPVLPVRGFIPVMDTFRFLQRGPVLELERLSDGAFQSVLPLEDAERVAGLLLRLRVEGRLVLEVRSG